MEIQIKKKQENYCNTDRKQCWKRQDRSPIVTDNTVTMGTKRNIKMLDKYVLMYKNFK